MPTKITLPLGEKLAYSIDEFHALGGPGRTTFYKLLASGALKAKKRGSSTVILREDAERFLASLPDYQA